MGKRGFLGLQLGQRLRLDKSRQRRGLRHRKRGRIGRQQMGQPVQTTQDLLSGHLQLNAIPYLPMRRAVFDECFHPVATAAPLDDAVQKAGGPAQHGPANIAIGRDRDAARSRQLPVQHHLGSPAQPVQRTVAGQVREGKQSQAFHRPGRRTRLTSNQQQNEGQR